MVRTARPGQQRSGRDTVPPIARNFANPPVQIRRIEVIGTTARVGRVFAIGGGAATIGCAAHVANRQEVMWLYCSAVSTSALLRDSVTPLPRKPHAQRRRLSAWLSALVAA